MSNKPQSYASHAKIDPPFHFFVLPVLLINILVVAYLLLRYPGIGGAWLLLVSVALLVLAGRLRSWATHLQDRVIRVEERIRLAAILPEPLRSRIAELSDSQIVGLRFASDAELPALFQRAVDEKLSRADIKKAIIDWRPDYSRV
ncbi:MAG TPA: DUF6526 family protein [Candidatus Angelobacter sp.]|jgi:hypothetical protein